MAILTKPSAEARVALIYITAGALLDVWSGVWYLYMREAPPATTMPYYVCTGFLLTGLILMLIGFGVGRIGRSARQAELPPPEVTPKQVVTDQVAPNPAVANPVAMPVAPGPPSPVAVAPAPPVPVANGNPGGVHIQRT